MTQIYLMVIMLAIFSIGFTFTRPLLKKSTIKYTIASETVDKDKDKDKDVVSKSDLVNILRDKTGFTKIGIETLISAFADTVREEVLDKGKEIRLRDFGTFRQRKNAARNGRNPQTSETIAIPASKSVAFTPSSSLKAKEESIATPKPAEQIDLNAA